MSKAKACRTSPEVTVRFECKAENAQAVFVAESFNDWGPETTPLNRGEDGFWAAALQLTPGAYEYKFVIDGAWCCSPELLPQPDQATCVHNDFGTMNFATKVPAPEQE